MGPESSKSLMQQFKKRVFFFFLMTPHQFDMNRKCEYHETVIMRHLWKFQTRYERDTVFTLKPRRPLFRFWGGGKRGLYGLCQQGAMTAHIHVFSWFAILVPVSAATVTYFYLYCTVFIVILWKNHYFKNFLDWYHWIISIISLGSN